MSLAAVGAGAVAVGGALSLVAGAAALVAGVPGPLGSVGHAAATGLAAVGLGAAVAVETRGWPEVHPTRATVGGVACTVGAAQLLNALADGPGRTLVLVGAGCAGLGGLCLVGAAVAAGATRSAR